MKIKKIIYNWHFTSDYGENYEVHEVGKLGVKEIAKVENELTPEIFCRVYFEDGNQMHDGVMLDIYRINQILWEKEYKK